MKAVFIAPRENYSGNLLWNKETIEGSEGNIASSLDKLREIGYWASQFPEGDGVTFSTEGIIKTNEEMLIDFKTCFNWIKVEQGKADDSNAELAELETGRKLKCIVIVPLKKIFIQETLHISNYSFFCRKEFDARPYERLADYDGEYLQFETSLSYKDLLKLNKTIKHNSYVVDQCISLAEHAMDLVRYVHSSFLRKEFTPNPAGQMEDGFYTVNIIPIEYTHLKSFELSGISRPFSISNNWLGPQVDHFYAEGIDYLSTIYSGDIENDMTAHIVSALRSCRQSFYALGSESQFLNLIFTLDGLTEADGTGWKHRTYLAALLCNKCPNRFEKVLKRYDELYCDVRNKLVHEGKDFYQINEEPEQACEEIYNYIKDIIKLVSHELFSDTPSMKAYAESLLKRQDFKDKYIKVINAASLDRGKNYQIPVW